MNESTSDFITRKNRDWEKNDIVRTKNITRRFNLIWKREAWTFMPQSNYNEKVFVIERLRKMKIDGKIKGHGENLGEVEYRIGYFIVGKIGRARGRWVWGQFCPLLPAQDLIELLGKAKEEKTILCT
ncbi:hypothetical protein A2215_01525 [Candidatus Berkelbacteria bacterium RIFOXYA2_FULL_43_10]|uniref:Uncharacterized protein n=1 Tax=Candidatus Berkelbacteria bacterium RIFOXYA2_FULL_43_10 TaxID=1797472 RepID=A0A1F5E6Z2_9BACT|nr:MAG: hypothetical protein A2215_01525 [Candidatus Berkelbacteria bacterium RIFOXYA2_FULL_43_10]